MKRLYSTYYLLQGLFLIGLSLLVSCIEPDIPTNDDDQFTDEIIFAPQLPEDWNALQGPKSAPAANGERQTANGAQLLTPIFTKEVAVGETPDGVPLLMRLVVEDGIESPIISKQETAGGGMPQVGHRTAALQKAASARTLGTGVQTPNQRKAANAEIDELRAQPMGIYAWLIEYHDEVDKKDYATLVSDKVAPIDEFMMNQVVNYTKIDANTSAWKYSPIKYWPHSNQYKLKFFAYHPHITEVNAFGEVKDTLAIDVSSKIPQMTYTVPTNPAHQVDLLSALPKAPNYSDMLTGIYNNDVIFPFNHMLSAVKVKIGALGSGEVYSFQFSNIYNRGTATMGAHTLTKTADAIKQNYIQDFTANPLVIADYNDKQIGQTMYLLPQTFEDDAMIEMNLGFTKTVAGETRTTHYPLKYPLNKLAPSIHTKWEAGNTYTYTITTPEEVNVEINDTVIGNVKKNVTITNTGLATVYIRAAIVGNWVRNVNGVDEIVTTWNSALDGTFVWGANWDTYWKRGSDGYYYYKCRVPRRETTTIPLFESYTLTAKAPLVDAELDLIIAVQAVLCEDIKGIPPNKVRWPADIVTWLSITEVP